MYNYKAYLAQFVERKAFNLEVVGSSSTVGIQYFLSLLLICFFVVEIFLFMPLICPSKFISHLYFFSFATDLFITFCLIVLNNPWAIVDEDRWRCAGAGVGVGDAPCCLGVLLYICLVDMT
jgi:hypothetical protein